MEKTSNKQKVIKGISSQTIVTFVLGAVEIVSFSIMSRLLSKEDFGYYAAITGIVTIFASFSETGIGSAIVQRKELTKRFVDNAFTLSFLFGLAISLLLFFLSETLADAVADRSMSVPLMLMSVTLLLHCVTSIFTSIMHRRLEFLRIGLINLFSLVITTLVAIWLAYEGCGYYSILTKAVMQSILLFLLSLYFCKTRFRFAFDRQTASSIFKFSGWLMASVLLRNLAHQIEKLMLPRLLSIEALGAYNRPKDFINQISTKLNGIFDTALFPVLSNLQDEKERLASAFRQSLTLLNTFAMLLSLSFIFNSQLIIRVFFGEEWLSLNSVTIILSLLMVFNIDGRLSDCYLRSMGLTKIQFYFRVFEAAFNIIGVVLSYRLGIIGVALSILVTNIISKLIKIIYIAVRVDISPISTIMVIAKSWRFTLIIVPICILGKLLIPNDFWGNALQLLIFITIVLIVFLLFPKFVGVEYVNTVYSKILKIRKRKTLS